VLKESNQEDLKMKKMTDSQAKIVAFLGYIGVAVGMIAYRFLAS